MTIDREGEEETKRKVLSSEVCTSGGPQSSYQGTSHSRIFRNPLLLVNCEPNQETSNKELGSYKDIHKLLMIFIISD